jgi:hypothetical protein
MFEVVVIPIGCIMVADAVKEAVALACANADAPIKDNTMKTIKFFTALFS